MEVLQAEEMRRRPVRNAHVERKDKLRIFEWVFTVMAAVMPLAIYRIPMLGFNISVDRALLLLCVLLFPYYASRKGSNFYLPIVIGGMGVLSVLITLLVNGGITSLARQYAPSLVQVYLLFTLGGYLFYNNQNSERIIRIIFLSWAAIIVVFCSYSFFYYYIIGTSHVPFPFLGYIADYDLQKMRMMETRRFFMPFASAPHLGAVSAIIAFWALDRFLERRRILFGMVFLVMLSACVLSLSRGPVLAFGISVLLFVVGLRTIGVKQIDKGVFPIVFGGVLFLSGLLLYQDLQLDVLGRATLGRIVSYEDILGGRHFSLRMFALTLVADGNLKEIMFGHGFGVFLVKGVGAYSFTSYLTLLAETGIVGSMVFLLAIFVPLTRSFFQLRFGSQSVRAYYFAFCGTILVFLLHSFYELKTVETVWVGAAYFFGLACSRSTPMVLDGKGRVAVRRP